MLVITVQPEQCTQEQLVQDVQSVIWQTLQQSAQQVVTALLQVLITLLALLGSTTLFLGKEN